MRNAMKSLMTLPIIVVMLVGCNNNSTRDENSLLREENQILRQQLDERNNSLGERTAALDEINSELRDRNLQIAELRGELENGGRRQATGFEGLSADRTIICPGAKGALYLALMVILSPGEESWMISTKPLRSPIFSPLRRITTSPSSSPAIAAGLSSPTMPRIFTPSPSSILPR